MYTDHLGTLHRGIQSHEQGDAAEHLVTEVSADRVETCGWSGEEGELASEIGTVMFGRHPDGSERPADLELVRLAMPRRPYTQSHMDYVIEVCGEVSARAGELRGYRIVGEPLALRHFTARFEPLQPH
jgi:tryptophanase